MKKLAAGFVSIALSTFLMGATLARSQTISQDLEIEDVFVQTLPPQDFVLDQALRPDDPLCEMNMLCTTYQGISEGTIGPIEVDDDDDDRSVLFIDFYGNYSCDGCSNTIPEPFVQIRFLLSKDGSPFEPINTAIIGSTLHNSGTDVVRQYSIPVETGTYTVQTQHRFSTTTAENPGRVGLTHGILRVEELDED